MFERRFRIIGVKILYYRKIKGWTQAELATKVGISPSYLSRIESGKYQGVPISTLMSISVSLDIDLVKLIEEE